MAVIRIRSATIVRHGSLGRALLQRTRDRANSLPGKAARWLSVALLVAAVVQGADEPLKVGVQPSPVYIELTTKGQAVNFDLIVENPGNMPWTLRAIEVSVMDRAGQPVFRQLVNDNGNSPGIELVNNREVAPGARLLIFNPLFAFAPDLALDQLQYRLDWTAVGLPDNVSTVISVRPQVYQPRTPLRLPLRGRVLVWDGHDFLSHHRRFNYLSRSAQASGATSNPDRFAYDLVAVDAEGRMQRGDPSNMRSWLGFGLPVYAAGSGKVVAATGDEPDNQRVNEERFRLNRLADYGNYIIVEHGPGEYALYGHLRHDSVRVRLGATVRQGDLLAAVGASGSSLMPHLHFQLQSNATADAEGLPSRFDAFRRPAIPGESVIARGSIDSGDIVEDVGSEQDAS